MITEDNDCADAFSTYFKNGGYQYSESNRLNALGWFRAGWEARHVAPTEGAPNPVDAEELKRLQAADIELQQERGYYLRQREKVEALRRDAACFQWLMSLQSGRPEAQIALAQVILAMRKNPEAVRKFIEEQIAALAANGEKV